MPSREGRKAQETEECESDPDVAVIFQYTEDKILAYANGAYSSPSNITCWRKFSDIQIKFRGSALLASLIREARSAALLEQAQPPPFWLIHIPR
jgi:hypothetical protein